MLRPGFRAKILCQKGKASQPITGMRGQTNRFARKSSLQAVIKAGEWGNTKVCPYKYAMSIAYIPSGPM